MKCYIFSMCLNEIAIIWHQFSFNLLKVNFWKIILLKHEKTYFKNTYSQQHFEHTRQCTYWIWGLQSIAAAYKTVCHFVKYRYMSLFWILLQWRIQKGAHPARIPSKVVKKKIIKPNYTPSGNFKENGQLASLKYELIENSWDFSIYIKLVLTV